MEIETRRYRLRFIGRKHRNGIGIVNKNLKKNVVDINRVGDIII